MSTTNLYKYSPDAVPPIHAVSYHVATDKPPTAQNGDKFRSIFSDNLQPIATRGKKARGTLLVDQHCGNGCSIKRAPLSVSYYNEISGGHIGRGCSEEMFCRPSTTPCDVNQQRTRNCRLSRSQTQKPNPAVLRCLLTFHVFLLLVFNVIY